MSEPYKAHTPGLVEALAKLAPDTGDKFVAMLKGFKGDVERIAKNLPYEPTALERLRAEQKAAPDKSPLRPFTALEDAFICEKARFWTAKQISREMPGRDPLTIAQRLRSLGVFLSDKSYFAAQRTARK